MTDTDQVAAIRELVAKHKAKALEKADKKAARRQSNEDIEASEETKQEPIRDIVVDGGDQDDVKMLETDTTFADLGVCPEICEAVKKMGYVNPSKI